MAEAQPEGLSVAFVQSRWEDLLEYFHSLLGTDMVAEDLAELQIRLEP